VLLPDNPAALTGLLWYIQGNLTCTNLSIDLHWDVPVNVNGFHTLVSHPTAGLRPPAFPAGVDFQWQAQLR